MSKPAIPAVNVHDKTVAAVLRPIKENIEFLTGVRGGRIRAITGLLDRPKVTTEIDIPVDPIMVQMRDAIVELIEIVNDQTETIESHRKKINELIDRLNA